MFEIQSVVTNKPKTSGEKEATDLIDQFSYAEFTKLLDGVTDTTLSSYDFRGQENLGTIREALSRKNADLFIPLFIIFKMRGAKLNKILSDPDLRSRLTLNTTQLKVFIPDTNSVVRRPPSGQYRLQSIALAFPHLMSMVSNYLEVKFPDRIFKQSEFSERIPKQFRWPGSICVFWAWGASNLDTEEGIIRVKDNINFYVEYIDKYIEVRRRTTEITEKQEVLNKINMTWMGRSLEHYTHSSLVDFQKDNKAPKLGSSWDEKKKTALCTKLGINIWAQVARPTNFNNLDDVRLQLTKAFKFVPDISTKSTSS